MVIAADYRKHINQFRDDEQRILTSLLYLNHNWCSEDGRQLRIYTNLTNNEQYEKILPIASRLVTFLNSRFFHAIMPSRSKRLSITGWFKTGISIN
jgi:SM-20-related protein